MLELKTVEDFQSFVADGRSVVEFYTSWCVDCKRIEPYLGEWEDSFRDRFKLARANAEEILPVSEQFDVKGIPSFLVFENGQLVNRLYSRDAKSKQQVASFLENAYIPVV